MTIETLPTESTILTETNAVRAFMSVHNENQERAELGRLLVDTEGTKAHAFGEYDRCLWIHYADGTFVIQDRRSTGIVGCGILGRYELAGVAEQYAREGNFIKR